MTLITKAEKALLDEITKIGYGELQDVTLPDQEPTVRVDSLTKNQRALLGLLKEYPEVEEIKIQDGQPMVVKIPYQSEFGKAVRRKVL